jgi:hypothetical protein
MGLLRISDGVTIDTCGEYCVIEKADGLYVVGNGFCVAVNNRAEADRTVAELTTRKEAR